jgi:hypothetical protein
LQKAIRKKKIAGTQLTTICFPLHHTEIQTIHYNKSENFCRDMETRARLTSCSISRVKDTAVDTAADTVADTAVDTAAAAVAADTAAVDTAVAADTAADTAAVAVDTAKLPLVLAQDTVEAKVAIQLSRKQCEILKSTLYG